MGIQQSLYFLVVGLAIRIERNRPVKGEVFVWDAVAVYKQRQLRLQGVDQGTTGPSRKCSYVRTIANQVQFENSLLRIFPSQEGDVTGDARLDSL